MNFCPCLEPIFKYFSKSDAKKQKTADTEEEAFINQPEEHLHDTIEPPSKPKLTINSQPTKPIPTYSEQEQEGLNTGEGQADLLQVKMELNTAANTKEESPKKQIKSIEDLLEEELSLTPQQAVIQHAEKKEEERPKQDIFEIMKQQINPQPFTINLDPIDPFFRVLHQKTSNISELLSKKGDFLEVGEPNKARLEVSVISNERLSTFAMTYRIKCPYSYYLSLLKNDKVNSSFSSLISEIKVIQAFKPNLTRNTIKFKRFGSFEARDCFYVKYQNNTKRQHWEVYIHDEKAELSTAYKTCELFCVKNIREEPKQLIITEYLQIDLQSASTASILPKLANEYRSYLSSMVSYIESNYEQESA